MPNRYGLMPAAVGLALLVACAPGTRTQPTYVSADTLSARWRTTAERTDYVETGRYDTVVGFCRRLADASPFAHYTTFGTSAAGRPLPLMVLSRDRAFTPEEAQQTDKLCVLVLNCIHPGECAGKDASLALMRDVLITGEKAHLLDHVILLVMPIFSPDGHERFSPYSRINQNGPKEMGWRVTATNLNLNRDFVKADAVEMQHWLRAWHAWRPDFLFDNHTTNGSDHQYDIFYAATIGQGIDPGLAGWMRDTLLPAVLPEVATDGFQIMEYSFPRDRADLGKGIVAATGFGPRYSTGYAALCNRPAYLVEAHALKPYRTRVRATYSLVLHTLEALNRRPGLLREAIATADARIAATHGVAPDGRVPLHETTTDEGQRFIYQGVRQRVRESDITGGPVIEYSDEPVEIETVLLRETRIDKAVEPAAAYILPPQWHDVIERLDWHAVEYFRLPRDVALEVEIARFHDVRFPERPYEGRFQPRYETTTVREVREYPEGTVVVPTDQARARLVAQLFEPDASDSFVAWGFFNAIFERKEYAEGYVMEPIARRMLAKDPDLRREFEEKLASDEEFAASPRARLYFFYKRSPYWDASLNVYPVARLTDNGRLDVLRRAAR